MDWNAAIERNREALKRVVAALAAMAGIAARPHPEVRADPEFVEGEPRRGPSHAICTAPCCASCARPKPPRGGW